jgi:hypothetical protein
MALSRRRRIGPPFTAGSAAARYHCILPLILPSCPPAYAAGQEGTIRAEASHAPTRAEARA